ncbi:hypothetical protein ACFE04_010893 [Oxalis oulophora]
MSLFSAAYGRIILLLFLSFVTCCCAYNKRIIQCQSSCGDIPKISYPFRLHDDPKNCGNPKYELFCEKNTTVLYSESYSESDTKRFVVRSIDYKIRTIRLVDDAIQKNNCSTLPSNSFLSSYVDPFESESYSSSVSYIILVSCKHQVNSPHYIDTSPCLNATDLVNNSKSPQRRMHSYVLAGKYIKASDLEDSCEVKLVVPSSSSVQCQNQCSYLDFHRQMSFGIEFSWSYIRCEECYDGYECIFNEDLTELIACEYVDDCGLACKLSSISHFCQFIN